MGSSALSMSVRLRDVLAERAFKRSVRFLHSPGSLLGCAEHVSEKMSGLPSRQGPYALAVHPRHDALHRGRQSHQDRLIRVPVVILTQHRPGGKAIRSICQQTPTRECILRCLSPILYLRWSGKQTMIAYSGHLWVLTDCSSVGVHRRATGITSMCEVGTGLRLYNPVFKGPSEYHVMVVVSSSGQKSGPLLSSAQLRPATLRV